MLSRQILRTLVLAVCWVVAGATALSAQGDRSVSDNSSQLLFVKYKDAKWAPVFPELGLWSPRLTILRVDSRTHATELLVRLPKNAHIPMHWHSANETQTVLEGNFIVLCAGKKSVMEVWDFNYVPKKMPFEAWTRKDGALLYITVDGAWDMNWVNGPPTREDMLGKSREQEHKD